MSKDFGLENHKAWLGLLQPVGLVVSPHALVQAQAAIDVNAAELQLVFKKLLVNSDGRLFLSSSSFSRLFVDVLGWRESDMRVLEKDSDVGSIFLKEYQETIAATAAVYGNKNDPSPMMLVQVLENDIGLDEAASEGWQTSTQTKFERLLREKSIPIGLLLNPSGIRLVYAPRGESSGYVTFPFSLMSEVSGRVVLGALKMLLGADRLFTLDPKERLPNLLVESRKYQNVVSTKLSEQVLAALYELLRGFQAANDHTDGKLLGEILKNEKDQIYHGLLTVLLRNVIVLFAEDRDLIPPHSIYVANYSIKGLFERLRADEAKFADTMDQRYGAWSQLIALYRIVYDGIEFPGFTLPARKGHLFDPDRFPFLEGRKRAEDPIDPPLISDGTIYRVLRNLMMLDGERISYRTLDVEQIGSVYETVMGFRLEVVSGPSIAIKPKKSHGAPVVIDLAAVLGKAAKDRSKFIKELTEQEIKPELLSEATSVEALEATLDKKISRLATPTVAPPGSMVLQPSDERRRSGSHYTPRSLTEPIVHKALEPVRARLQEDASPDQILGLKICDPAMGSGAFLVEATRQLAEWLVASWRINGSRVSIPPDEDELTYAKRMIVQRCIYGVDKNPMAVDLAKLSLWLATFAKDHAFTFLDHALKHGDSLIGLTLEQIGNCTWTEESSVPLFTNQIKESVEDYIYLRGEIQAASDESNYLALQHLNEEADSVVNVFRLLGNAVVRSFFSATKPKEKKAALEKITHAVATYGLSPELQSFLSGFGEEAGVPFHWELEFPEVFQDDRGGFDVIVGNPPFLGGKNISGAFGAEYTNFLINTFSESGGQADLVVYFLRRCFQKIRVGGTVGIIATNTISQGDSRLAGLGYLYRNSSCDIYSAVRRIKWPGEAAVTVSVIHLFKGKYPAKRLLDGFSVDGILPFLVPALFEYREPLPISFGKPLGFSGIKPNGEGFFFQKKKSKGGTLEEGNRLLESPSNRSILKPCIGGEDVVNSPSPVPIRYVIDFVDRNLEEAKKWPELLSICENRVQPDRAKQKGAVRNIPFWLFEGPRIEMRNALAGKSHYIFHSYATEHFAFLRIPSDVLPLAPHAVIASDSWRDFAILQSRVHEVWSRFFGSTLEDRLCYTSSNCLDGFPFPPSEPKLDEELISIGSRYYEFRSEIMRRLSIGLTELYNRFHDSEHNSADIIDLRRLHSELDLHVLSAFGWPSISRECDFVIEHETADVSESFGDQDATVVTRYRWSNPVRDEVLARLLELNAALSGDLLSQKVSAKARSVSELKKGRSK